MTDTTALVHRYIAMWNETDAERRRALVADTVTDDADYLDPVMSAEGAQAISDMIAGAQAQYPGHRFALHTAPDAHHDRVRFSWALAAGGDPVAIGLDVAVLAADGRMRSITGFIEPAS